MKKIPEVVAKAKKIKELEQKMKKLKHKLQRMKFDVKHNKKMAAFMAIDPDCGMHIFTLITAVCIVDHKICMVYQSSPPPSQLELVFRVFRAYSE